MSTTITEVFRAEMESGIKLAYQQMGSKLRGTVRIKNGLRGSTVDFNKIGKGAASQKSRGGDVIPMNPTHAKVTATMTDWYAGDYVGKIDEKKITFDDKEAIRQTGSGAIGRKADNLIITALDATTNTVAVGSTGLSKAKILSAFETLNGNDVPDDGNRYFILGAHQWNEAINITEFKSAEYIGQSDLPWLRGTSAKRWLGFIWLMHSGLPLSSGTRKVFAYHKQAIGYAEAQEMYTDISWVPQKAEHFVDTMISAGAIIIDADGIVEISCDDDATIT
jgi:hypothetical protein